MERSRRREVVLAAVAVVLVGIAVWALQPGAPQQSAGSTSPPTAATTNAAGKDAVTQVDLDALKAERSEPEDTSRNPFRFKEKPPPPPPPPTPAEKLAKQQAILNTPVEPPPPPRIPLKYIGEFADPSKPGRKVAILSDARGVYHGREGDVIEGRYRIERIGVESIELSYLDGRGRQTIRQTGQ